MGSLRENLEREMDRMDWNAYDLANASGIPKPTIYRILSGEQDDPRSNTVKKLAHALGITEAQLRGLDDYIDGTVVSETLSLPGPEVIERLPVINLRQAGNWTATIDNHYPGDTEEWRPTTVKVSKNAYALRIEGDSMINPNGYPSLPPGAIVIVEPNKQPQNGDIVIARLEDSMEATIKKLVIDGNQKFLKPLNPQYPIIEINGNFTICGVAIKVEMDLQ